jgi:hypothetical protein
MITPIPQNVTGDALIAAMNNRIQQINIALGPAAAGAASGAASIGYGTHALRIGRPVPAPGSIYIETDRDNIAYQVQVAGWVYAGGVLSAAFASAPAGLGTADAGLLWNVSDYAHVLAWSGTGWAFFDAMGGYIEGRVVAPDGAGWHVCDGTATSYLHVAAGVASAVAFTTPNLAATAAFAKLGSAYGAVINAATLPTASGPTATVAAAGAGTAAGPTHTHVITLPGDPVANVAMAAYFRR